MIIYLDIDGVLANFNKAMITAFGKPYHQLNEDIDQRWVDIARFCPDVFLNLEKMPDADLLVDGVTSLCEEYGCHIGILTALPVYGIRSGMFTIEGVSAHKHSWISQRWPHLAENFNIGPYAVNKQTFSSPSAVLIDDSELNIPQWNARGGYGILHTSASSSLEQLLHILEKNHDLP